jgi:hypothetical protein
VAQDYNIGNDLPSHDGSLIEQASGAFKNYLGQIFLHALKLLFSHYFFSFSIGQLSF